MSLIDLENGDWLTDDPVINYEMLMEPFPRTYDEPILAHHLFGNIDYEIVKNTLKNVSQIIKDRLRVLSLRDSGIMEKIVDSDADFPTYYLLKDGIVESWIVCGPIEEMEKFFETRREIPANPFPLPTMLVTRYTNPLYRENGFSTILTYEMLKDFHQQYSFCSGNSIFGSNLTKIISIINNFSEIPLTIYHATW